MATTKSYEGSIERPCERCGEPFRVFPYQLRRGQGRFCSPRCNGNGTPLGLSERFFGKVNRQGPTPGHVPELGPCWVWTGNRRSSGYGALWVPGTNRSVAAHRVSWELHHGAIPAGLVVMHRCDHPPCVNPAHLTVGTRSDNMRDMAAKGRQWQQRHPERRRRGTRSHYAVTTEDAVRVMRRLVAYGVPALVVSGAFGLSVSAVRAAVEGLTWAHVEDDREVPVLSETTRRQLEQRFGGVGDGDAAG